MNLPKFPGLDALLHVRSSLATAVALLCTAALSGQATADPASFDMELPAAQSRSIDVQVTYPEHGCEPCQLVIFSHGAYAAPQRYARLLRAWAAAGYAIAAPMHVDSELHPDREQYDAAATLLARLEDFALLTDSQRLRDELRRRGLGLRDGVIAAGHSYGALIAQAAAGARLQQADPAPAALVAARKHILGVVALSPPGAPAVFGVVARSPPGAEDWALVARPMLVVTGTTDVFPEFFDDWRVHLASFEAAALAPAYALVFTEQDHYFNGSFGRPKDDLSPATEEALDRLTTLTVMFMGHLTAGNPPAPADWIALSEPMVEARVRP